MSHSSNSPLRRIILIIVAKVVVLTGIILVLVQTI